MVDKDVRLFYQNYDIMLIEHIGGGEYADNPSSF